MLKRVAFEKSLKAIWNLLVGVLFVSLLHLSAVRCLPVSGTYPLCRSWNPSCFDSTFYRSRWTVFRMYGLCICICRPVYMFEWCVLAQWVFVPRKYLSCIGVIHYYYYYFSVYILAVNLKSSCVWRRSTSDSFTRDWTYTTKSQNVPNQQQLRFMGEYAK